MANAKSAADIASSSNELPHSLKRAKRRRRMTIAVVLLAAAAGGTYYYLQPDDVVENTDEDLIATVQYGDIESTVSSVGELVPRKIVEVGARVSGQLETLHVEVGDEVEEGDLLAEIDAREFQNQVDKAVSSLDAQIFQLTSQELQLENAQRNYERQLQMFEAEAISPQELESAEASLEAAKSSLFQLEQRIEQAEKDLETDRLKLGYTQISAPLSGTVVSIAMEEGQTLNASQTAPTVLSLADLSTMTVETEISEADVGQLEPGMEVYFTTLGNGDRRWYSTLRQILPTPVSDSGVVLYPGLFDTENPDGALRVGMTTQVYFVLAAARDVLTVPLGALTFIQEEPGANGAASRRNGGANGAANGAGEDIRSRISQMSEAEREEMARRFAQARESGQFPGGGGRGGGGFPGGGFPGGGFPGGNGGGDSGSAQSLFAGVQQQSAEPRRATVELVLEDGSRETREVMIGVTDRVNAEVLSGLQAGDRVIAGIYQQPIEDDDDNNNWRPPGGMRFFF